MSEPASALPVAQETETAAQQTCTQESSHDYEEVGGYEDPFATFSWSHWLEQQAQMVQQAVRFQRAIARRQTKLALLIAIEMQELLLEWVREATAWVDTER